MISCPVLFFELVDNNNGSADASIRGRAIPSAGRHVSNEGSALRWKQRRPAPLEHLAPALEPRQHVRQFRDRVGAGVGIEDGQIGGIAAALCDKRALTVCRRAVDALLDPLLCSLQHQQTAGRKP